MSSKDISNTKEQDNPTIAEENKETSIAPENLEASTNESVTKSIEDKAAATPPSKEQSDYWEKDLALKRKSFRLSLIGFFVIILSIWFNANQISISTDQLKLNTKQVQLNTEQSERLAESLCYQVQNQMLTHVIDLDKVFLERTYLRAYFYEDKPITAKDKYYQEATATAEMVLDIFDVIADQNKKYPKCYDNAAAWDAWVMDMFSTSPILRETMDERRDWYAKNLSDLYGRALERMNQPGHPPITPAQSAVPSR